jgi:hypothetical protein
MVQFSMCSYYTVSNILAKGMDLGTSGIIMANYKYAYTSSITFLQTNKIINKKKAYGI